MRETHPYNLDKTIPIPDGTRTLIIGTAPPPRFSNPACGGMIPGDFNFFYGSTDSKMWEFLSDSEANIIDKRLSSDQRRNAACIFLEKKKIWMRDVLQKYERKPGKQCSADDCDINIISPPNKNATTFTDFAQVCAVRSIVRFAFTSEKAAEWTFKAPESQNSIVSRDLSAVFGAWNAALNAWKRDWKINWNPLWSAQAVTSLVPEQVGQIKQFWLAVFNKKIFSFPVTVNSSQRNIDCYLLPTPAKRSGRRPCLTKDVKQKIYRNILF